MLRQSLLAAFDAHCPRDMILRRRGPPHNTIEMANGFVWVLHSAESELEGIEAAVVGIDEISHASWSSTPYRFLNLLARLRDPHARYMALIASGLPEAGFVRDQFDTANRPDDPNRHLTMMSTRENVHLPREMMKAFMDACPGGQEQKLIGGTWMPPQGAIYSAFDADRHLVEYRGLSNATCHVGLDAGNKGAAVIGQEIDVDVRDLDGKVRTEKGLLIVDQILTDGESVEHMCHRLTQSGWRFDANSIFSVDPTIRKDETNAIRTHFPHVRVVKRERGDEHFPIESGIRVTQRALLDALGNVRLFFWRGLAPTPLGIVDGMQRYQRNAKTQEAIKDNSRDHALDALRYLVCSILPPSKPEARYWKQ